MKPPPESYTYRLSVPQLPETELLGLTLPPLFPYPHRLCCLRIARACGVFGTVAQSTFRGTVWLTNACPEEPAFACAAPVAPNRAADSAKIIAMDRSSVLARGRIMASFSFTQCNHGLCVRCCALADPEIAHHPVIGRSLSAHRVLFSTNWWLG